MNNNNNNNDNNNNNNDNNQKLKQFITYLLHYGICDDMIAIIESKFLF